jgi:NhaP-type Na+/H+ or K+/H+ antiporter
MLTISTYVLHIILALKFQGTLEMVTICIMLKRDAKYFETLTVIKEIRVCNHERAFLNSSIFIYFLQLHYDQNLPCLTLLRVLQK